MSEPKTALSKVTNLWGANRRICITLIGIALLVALSVVTYLALPKCVGREVFWSSFLVICLGGCIGALLGALASPFQSTEKDTFTLVAGIASAFLTGFLWKSFEDEIRAIVHSGDASDVASVRLLAFAVATFFSAFVNYAFRAYGEPQPQKTFDAQLKEVRSALDKLEAIVVQLRDK
jgi:hypothetical protein